MVRPERERIAHLLMSRILGHDMPAREHPPRRHQMIVCRGDKGRAPPSHCSFKSRHQFAVRRERRASQRDSLDGCGGVAWLEGEVRLGHGFIVDHPNE